MIIPIVTFDPSFRNFGMAEMTYNLDSGELAVVDLKLIETEKRAGKTVRQNSDDLRRAQEIFREFTKFAKRGRVAFAEIPTGAQSARAMYAFGVSVGLLAACPIPLLQIQPFETKLATVGTKTASKEEMIEFATGTYPCAPWIKRAGKLTLKNEHLADAVAVAHAGILTDQFQQLLAIWRSAPIAA
jgi:Holliday junction resolvasome RuvABC endonuclease subunit